MVLKVYALSRNYLDCLGNLRFFLCPNCALKVYISRSLEYKLVITMFEVKARYILHILKHQWR